MCMSSLNHEIFIWAPVQQANNPKALVSGPLLNTRSSIFDIFCLIWRQVLDKMWHQNPMPESRRENLFLVLTRHKSELQKYICWLVFSWREHLNFSNCKIKHEGRENSSHDCQRNSHATSHRRPSAQISQNWWMDLGRFGWFCVVLDGFGWFHVLVTTLIPEGDRL